MADAKPSDRVVLSHGELVAPAWLPDATRAVVRCVDSVDLRNCGVVGLVVSTFHLLRNPGIGAIAAAGGLHRFLSWPLPVVTDSGGFQLFSLVRQNRRQGSITEKGVFFRPDAGSRLLLTPEKSIQFQFRCGADLLICLDDCTWPDDPLDTQRESVERTVSWARRCKVEYDRQLASRRLENEHRPLLFAVVQGGSSRDLRRQCAEQLLEIGFDGYGFGGWPIDDEGNLLLDMLAFTREIIPAEYPMHALGVGHPVSLAKTANMGYALYDCTMPTRDARRKRLYVMDLDRLTCSAEKEEWFSTVFPQDEKYRRASSPVDAACDCLCCHNYSLGYLHHLSRIDEPCYERLATIHNIRSMVRLTDRLRSLRFA
jgi:queuine tRNA-ribosyltransferase